jgi:hypothetical protein
MHDGMTLMWSVRLRRARAVAAAVLGLGVAALAAPAASDASVASVCREGEFCLWSDYNQRGGLYHYAGSDSTLWNDRFENELTNLPVGNNTMSFRNRGTTAGGPAHVRVFDGVSFTGPHTCAPQGSRGNFRWDSINRMDWANRVESYVWRYSC